MTLGEIIKNYRLEHGLSQDDIANRSGLSKSYISILERNRNPKTGEPPIASLKTINAIAKAIDSDFDTIFSKLDSNLKISIGEQLPTFSCHFLEKNDKNSKKNSTITNQTKKYEETNEEKNIILRFRLLTPDNRAKLSELMDLFLGSQNKKE